MNQRPCWSGWLSGRRTFLWRSFGAHDYIAFKALDRAPAAKVAFIKQRLFIGTEAPDTNKKIPSVTEGGYMDSLKCHCILFAEDLTITKAHARDRIREEFDRAVAALAANKKERAAFFAGAMAHYLGDLSQFHHMMGTESHWGAEDQTVHAAYESAVDRCVDFMTHGSSLLDPFLAPVTVEGDTPEDIAEAVALFVERGGDDAETPGMMNMRALELRMAGKLGKPEQWTTEFRNRTGTNVNFAVNAIGKLLEMIADETP
jgi:Zinc dependent phospholipase C